MKSVRIQTEYEEILRIYPNSVQMRKNTDQKNSEYGHFLRSVSLKLSATHEATRIQSLFYYIQNTMTRVKSTKVQTLFHLFLLKFQFPLSKKVGLIFVN